MKALCLAIDPGPTRCGFAIVELDGARFALKLGTHTAPDDPKLALDALVAKIRADVVAGEEAFVALESIDGYVFAKARSKAVIQTARVEQDLYRRVTAAEAWLEIVVASVWRARLCRSRTASDTQVRIAVEALLGRVDVPAKERPHVLDAAGLAIVMLAHNYGLLEQRGSVKVVPLPPAIEAALAARRALEKAQRERRKVAKAAGVKLPPMRVGSRQRAKARAGAKLVKAARR